ncbi:hypothetical protein [Sphingomonas profundi]|uniref:hypothetical protein n=1 Tax=Alterirhizorhabdus profundi TaxID=2681549 RepID=UPI0012E85310|nr:hypothetical protein [Sphingomonas profundi]
MRAADSGDEGQSSHAQRVATSVRAALERGDCPAGLVATACAAAEQAATRAVRAAESRERLRIIRWLRTVATVYADRFRAGRGEESVYWFDQLEAFSHAADAIARRRHARPH